MLWKYLSRIDRLFKRTVKPGYCKERFLTENIIVLKDKKLWFAPVAEGHPKLLSEVLYVT